MLAGRDWFKRYGEPMLARFKEHIWSLGADFEPHRRLLNAEPHHPFAGGASCFGAVSLAVVAFAAGRSKLRTLFAVAIMPSFS